MEGVYFCKRSAQFLIVIRASNEICFVENKRINEEIH